MQEQIWIFGRGEFLLQAISSLLENRYHRVAKFLILAICLFCVFSCFAEAQDVLCDQGVGGFHGEFHSTGIEVTVGASRNSELATRRCEAALAWGKDNIVVAASAWQIDIDTLGADLGLGGPVVAFQVKESDKDCCREYKIYSLTKPPRLLRSLGGGSSFNAADKDLDGRVEIWTDDAAGIEGFDGLSLAELDAAPTIVLRFSHGRLMDVSSEFQPEFDHHILEIQKELRPDDLQDFQNSDGKLASARSQPAERLHKLRRTKARILEIVWAYLYSGREEQAWRSLAEMWPTNDAARVREAIVSARAHGISAQLAAASSEPSPKREKRVTIFDAVMRSEHGKPEVVPPEPILLLRSPGTQASGEESDKLETMVDLVVDSAGKVRSAEAAGKAQVDPALIHAASGWKFIPAYKDGRSVACRTRISVSPKQ